MTAICLSLIWFCVISVCSLSRQKSDSSELIFQGHLNLYELFHCYPLCLDDWLCLQFHVLYLVCSL